MNQMPQNWPLLSLMERVIDYSVKSRPEKIEQKSNRREISI